MEDLIRCYQKFIRLLEEEDEKIALSLQGPYLEQYRKILRKERERIEEKLRELYTYQQIKKGD